jgi:hypothetical protein
MFVKSSRWGAISSFWPEEPELAGKIFTNGP